VYAMGNAGMIHDKLLHARRKLFVAEAHDDPRGEFVQVEEK
jgi:hypothetical protein